MCNTEKNDIEEHKEDIMENEDSDEMTMEEVVDTNDVILHSLIELLIEKNVITEEDLRKRLEEEDEGEN